MKAAVATDRRTVDLSRDHCVVSALPPLFRIGLPSETGFLPQRRRAYSLYWTAITSSQVSPLPSAGCLSSVIVSISAHFTSSLGDRTVTRSFTGQMLGAGGVAAGASGVGGGGGAVGVSSGGSSVGSGSGGGRCGFRVFVRADVAVAILRTGGVRLIFKQTVHRIGSVNRRASPLQRVMRRVAREPADHDIG